MPSLRLFQAVIPVDSSDRGTALELFTFSLRETKQLIRAVKLFLLLNGLKGPDRLLWVVAIVSYPSQGYTGTETC